MLKDCPLGQVKVQAANTTPPNPVKPESNTLAILAAQLQQMNTEDKVLRARMVDF